ncbi:MAG: HEAT repeat domain-containing protein [Candidatus Wallbacteria bacterium]|nr:HEAT repeat domain-containing protein [Candidatus Wallbacteria bacterium]
MNKRALRLFLHNSPENAGKIRKIWPTFSNSDLSGMLEPGDFSEAQEALGVFLNDLSEDKRIEWLGTVNSLNRELTIFFAGIFVPSEEFSPYNKALLQILSTSGELPRGIPPMLTGFIRKQFDILKHRNNQENENFYLILKTVFLLKDQAYSLYEEILGNDSPQIFRVEAFNGLAKLKRTGISVQDIENRALKELTPNISFLLFKSLGSCLAGSKEPAVVQRLFNYLDLKPPYLLIVLDIISGFDYSTVENIMPLLTQLFSCKEIVNDEKRVVLILERMRSTNPSFDKKFIVFLKDMIRHSKQKIGKIPQPKDELDDLLGQIKSALGKYPSKDLYTGLLGLLKTKNNQDYMKAAEGFLKLLNAIPEEIRNPFKEILKFQDERRKILMRQKLEEINFEDLRYDFVDLLALLRLIERIGNTEYFEVLKSFLDLTGNEHLIAKVIYLFGKFKINESLGIVMQYSTSPIFTIRGNAVYAIGRLAHGESLPLLLSLAGDASEWIRLQAVQALYACADQSAIPDIRNMLKHESFPRIRVEIVKLLMKFDPSLEEMLLIVDGAVDKEEVLPLVLQLQPRFSDRNVKERILDAVVSRFPQYGPFFGGQGIFDLNATGDLEWVESLLRAFPSSSVVSMLARHYVESDDDRCELLLLDLKNDKKLRTIIDEELEKLAR